MQPSTRFSAFFARSGLLLAALVACEGKVVLPGEGGAGGAATDVATSIVTTSQMSSSTGVADCGTLDYASCLLAAECVPMMNNEAPPDAPPPPSNIWGDDCCTGCQEPTCVGCHQPKMVACPSFSFCESGLPKDACGYLQPSYCDQRP